MVEEKGKTIGFRVTDEEYKQFERIAAILNSAGKLRNDTVGSLARALCFVKLNVNVLSQRFFVRIVRIRELSTFGIPKNKSNHRLQIERCSSTRTRQSVKSLR